MDAVTWHAAYRERVLEPDYAFASKHLKDHLLDALQAHVRTVATLPIARERQETFRALEAALAEVRANATPLYEPSVPDLYFALQHVVARCAGEGAGIDLVASAVEPLVAGMTVIKLSPEGAAYLEGGRLRTATAPSVAPVGTVGAGDTFGAALIAGRIAGWPWHQAIGAEATASPCAATARANQ